MSARWLLSLGVSLALTLLIEGGIAFLARRRGRALRVVLLVNLLTNPAVVFFVLWGRSAGWPHMALWTALAELAAFAAEGAVYRSWREDFPHPWRFSLLLNGLSFGIGLLLSYL